MTGSHESSTVDLCYSPGGFRNDPGASLRLWCCQCDWRRGRTAAPIAVLDWCDIVWHVLGVE